MINRRNALLGATALITTSAGIAVAAKKPETNFDAAPERSFTDNQWKAKLSPDAYQVLRREATEHPETSSLNSEHRKGVFSCAGCALPLFKSNWKFDSGTGWPSFYQAIDSNIGKKTDTSAGMVRTEYHCARCLGHQGHLFTDGPPPTGLRYCNNGVALTFKAA